MISRGLSLSSRRTFVYTYPYCEFGSDSSCPHSTDDFDFFNRHFPPSTISYGLEWSYFGSLAGLRSTPTPILMNVPPGLASSYPSAFPSVWYSSPGPIMAVNGAETTPESSYPKSYTLSSTRENQGP